MPNSTLGKTDIQNGSVYQNKLYYSPNKFSALKTLHMESKLNMILMLIRIILNPYHL